MKDFENLVRRAKAEDPGAMLELIDAFAPLIGKYTRMMNYDEDFRCDMILKLIVIVKREMDLDALRDTNNFTILKYIKTALYRHYITLSKRRNNIENHESACEYGVVVEMTDQADSYMEGFLDGLYLENVRDVLTAREYYCIESIIIKGYTANLVAQKLGVTKQAVNQCKNRALSKIRRKMAE